MLNDHTRPAPDDQAVAALIAAELDKLVGSDNNLMAVSCLDMLFPSGKLLRPRLCLWSATAAGGDFDAAVPFAAGIEALHVATLIHDDVIDQAPTRRGRASTVQHLGLCRALLAGDGLASLGYTAMLGTLLPADRVNHATQAVARALSRMSTAVMQEALVREDLHCPVSTVLDIISGKTAALTSAACQAGALLADAAPSHVEAMRVYGEELGIAFQIRDDLLPYTTSTTTAHSDVTNRQPTLPILLAYEAAQEGDRQRLREAFHGDLHPADAHQQVTGVLTRTGAINRATELALSHAAQARSALAPLPGSTSRDRLTVLADTAVDREQ